MSKAAEENSFEVPARVTGCSTSNNADIPPPPMDEAVKKKRRKTTGLPGSEKRRRCSARKKGYIVEKMDSRVEEYSFFMEDVTKTVTSVRTQGNYESYKLPQKALRKLSKESRCFVEKCEKAAIAGVRILLQPKHGPTPKAELEREFKVYARSLERRPPSTVAQAPHLDARSKNEFSVIVALQDNMDPTLVLDEEKQAEVDNKVLEKCYGRTVVLDRYNDPLALCLPSHELMPRLGPVKPRLLSIGDVLVMKSCLIHCGPASKNSRAFLFFVVSMETDKKLQYKPDEQLTPWSAICEATTDTEVVTRSLHSWISCGHDVVSTYAHNSDVSEALKSGFDASFSAMNTAAVILTERDPDEVPENVQKTLDRFCAPRSIDVPGVHTKLVTVAGMMFVNNEHLRHRTGEAHSLRPKDLGAMQGAGYAGPHCNRMFYRNTFTARIRPELDTILALLLSAVSAGERRALLPHGGNVQDLLHTPGCPSVFVTVNYAHVRAPGRKDETDIQLHRDVTDQSLTVLAMYQDAETPDENSAFWMDDALETPMAIRGGICRVFNGRELHGTRPPRVFNPEFPWYGLALVAKGKDPRDSYKYCK